LRISKLSLAITAIAVALFTAPAPALADTYQIFRLSDANRTDLMGIDDAGTVVLYDVRSGTYETFVKGISIGKSSINPGLVFDNGTPCVADVPAEFGSGFRATCNNGHQIYGTGIFQAPPYRTAIFDGPDPTIDRVADGDLDVIVLNSSGDFAFVANEGISGPDLDGEIYQAIDLTSDVPEPSSIFLLSTGVFAAAGLRRRLFQRK